MKAHKVDIENLPLNKEVIGITEDDHVWLGWFEIIDHRPMFMNESIKLRSVTHYILPEDILKLKT